MAEDEGSGEASAAAAAPPASGALKDAVAAKDPPTQEQKMALYNQLLQQAAFELGKLDCLKSK